MLSSSCELCELDRHISMLSSSCDKLWSCESSLTIPNEDFGGIDKRRTPDFRLTFQWFVPQVDFSRTWKVLRKFLRLGSIKLTRVSSSETSVNYHLKLFMLPKRRFWKVGQTFQSAFPGEALFKGVITRFGIHNVEKCFEKRFLKFCPTFQNLRLGGVKFDRHSYILWVRQTHRHAIFILWVRQML